MNASTGPSSREELLLRLFQQLRASGLTLGIAELLAARRALAAGLGGIDEDGLGRLLRPLWCHSAAQNAELDALLNRLWNQADDAADTAADAERRPDSPPPVPPPPESQAERLQHASPSPPSIPAPAPGIRPLPIRAPLSPEHPDAASPLLLYDPVSRRSMAYIWRYLRRPVKDGPRDVLDLDATVERTTRLGYFDGPVFGRRGTDHGHLVLLVDQGGSMVPFHRLTRDLVQTAADSAQGNSGRRVDIAYFQNVPPARVHLDPYLTRPLDLDWLLADCTSESSVLIASDAGAARGALDRRRFTATVRILVRLRQRVGSLAWLNPVPAQRWPGSTAALIAAVVPMFAMDEDGFGNAVDVLRGQSGWGRA
jgi:uncharacterized protein